jgi:TonB family protein
MNNIINFVVTGLIYLVSIYPAFDQESLPTCPFSGAKDNCISQFSDASGNYTSEYRNGRPEGKVSIVFANGGTFNGRWKDGKFYGFGSAITNDGTKYEGEYKEGKFNGIGALSLPNGSRYVGGFKDDKFDGVGKMYSKDGRLLVDAIWKDGKLVEAVNSPSQSTTKIGGKEKDLSGVEQVRAEQLARLRGAAVVEGSADKLGGWPYKISGKVKPLIVFDPNSIVGNPVAEVSVYLSPEGYILRKRLVASSGSGAWDNAVLSALDKANSLPLSDDGGIPQNPVILKFQPKESTTSLALPVNQIDIQKFTVLYQPDADAYYPAFSKRSNEQGEVIVQMIVGENGHVENVTLLRSSSFPRLDRAATEIAKRYRFKPFLVNGKPTKVSTNLLIKFNLKNEEEKGVKPKFEPNPLTMGG